MPRSSAESGAHRGAQTVAGAGLLAHAGLLPFVILSAWLYAIPPQHPWHDATILLLVGYAAIVLSFLGGLRWGLAVARPDRASRRDLWLGIVPALVGWGALATPVPYAFGLLAVAFAAQGAWDSLSAQDGPMPAWFGRLRTRLTVVVVAMLVLALAATA